MRGTLMIQGTTSDAGKSTLVAGLCRLLHRQGVRVVPFKPQNMALNSAVTIDGGEIGRAQAVQAEAAGLEPHTDMNPVLLKPSSDTRAQVIVHGRVRADMEAGDYHRYKTIAMEAVLESYERLRQQYDVVIVEGAGSPAEINLRDRDIANMGFARRSTAASFSSPTSIAAACLRSSSARSIAFRGARSGDCRVRRQPVSWRHRLALSRSHLARDTCAQACIRRASVSAGLHLDAEDAIATEQTIATRTVDQLRVAVPVFPRISNHTDFDALRAHPRVNVTFVGPGMAFPNTDLVILPGSKNTRADLGWLIEQGFDEKIRQHVRYGGKVIGICGGMQMLGVRVDDPDGVEGAPGSTPGLGLLEFVTTLTPQKSLQRVTGRLCIVPGAQGDGLRNSHGRTPWASDGSTRARSRLAVLTVRYRRTTGS
jgi:adenosylcobyric acid synthase